MYYKKYLRDPKFKDKMLSILETSQGSLDSAMSAMDDDKDLNMDSYGQYIQKKAMRYFIYDTIEKDFGIVKTVSKWRIFLSLLVFWTIFLFGTYFLLYIPRNLDILHGFIQVAVIVSAYFLFYKINKNYTIGSLFANTFILCAFSVLCIILQITLKEYSSIYIWVTAFLTSFLCYKFFNALPVYGDKSLSFLNVTVISVVLVILTGFICNTYYATSYFDEEDFENFYDYANTLFIEQNENVYWVENGKVFHINGDCDSLENSTDIRYGTVEESNKERLCKVCAEDAYNNL